MNKDKKLGLILWSILMAAFIGFFFLFRYSSSVEEKPTNKLEAAKKVIKTLTRINRDLDVKIGLLRKSNTVVKLRRCRNDFKAHFCPRYDVTGNGCRLAKKGESWDFAIRHFYNDRIDLFYCSSRSGNPAIKGMSRSELARWYKKGRECALYWVTMMERPSSSRNHCYYDKKEILHCSTIRWNYKKEDFDE